MSRIYTVTRSQHGLQHGPTRSLQPVITTMKMPFGEGTDEQDSADSHSLKEKKRLCVLTASVHNTAGDSVCRRENISCENVVRVSNYIPANVPPCTLH